MIHRKRGLSFGAKFALLYSSVFAVIFACTGLYLAGSSENQALNILQDSLFLQARQLREVFHPAMIEQDSSREIQELVQRIAGKEDVRVTIINKTGQVLGDSRRNFDEVAEMENHAGRPEVKSALAGKAVSEIHESATLRIRMLYVAVPVMRDNAVVGAIRVSVAVSKIRSLLDAVRKPFFYGTGIGIFLVFLLGYFLGRPMTKRISMMTAAAIRYARGDLSRKFPVTGEDEFAVLADAMNKMASTLKKRIQENENEKKNLAAILSSMAEGVIAVDESRSVLLANPSAEKLFQIKSTQNEMTLLAATHKPQLDELMKKAMQSGVRLMEEIELTLPEARVLRASAVSIVPGGDNRVRGILVLSDITKIRRLETMRRDFVANVSHELRTPLTSLRGFIETLLSGALEDAKTSKRFLSMMEEDALRLERLIDDLLDLSRLEEGKTRPSKQPIRLYEEVESLAVRLKNKMDEKNISFKNEVPKEFDEFMGDKDQLKQVLINLLDNAIKFNRENGSVTVRAEQSEKTVKVEVQDTGRGIPEEAQGRLFERFFRVDKARSRELGGTGLGLSIVKHIVEAHGGNVSCESTMGEGSIFSFVIPRA